MCTIVTFPWDGRKASFLFSTLTRSAADFSLSHPCSAGELHTALGFAGVDLPQPLPNAGISPGFDFFLPLEFFFSFLQHVVSWGVAVHWLKFL